MEQSTVILEEDAAGHRALLTLRRGVSAWGTWAFDSQDAGTTITIGSTSGCDWQIASPGVPPLTLLFTGETLLARTAKEDPRVRLNGASMWPGWVTLRHGDRLELGPSCVEVKLSSELRPTASKTSFDSKQRPPRRRKHRGGARSERGRPPEERSGPGVLVRPRIDYERESSRPSNVPAVFQERRRRRAGEPNAAYWYLAIGVATALAYAGWLALLEYL